MAVIDLNQISWSHGPVTSLFAVVSVFLIPAPLLILLLVDWGEKSRPAQVFSVTATDLLSVSQRTLRRKRIEKDLNVIRAFKSSTAKCLLSLYRRLEHSEKHAGVKKEKR